MRACSIAYPTLLFLTLLGATMHAQKATVSGVVIASMTLEKLSNVRVHVEKTTLGTKTDVEGAFCLNLQTLPEGVYALKITMQGYGSKRLSFVKYQDKQTDIGTIVLDHEHTQGNVGLEIIELSDQELNDDADSFVTIAGALHANKDVFIAAAAYDFSAAFFRPRGQDNAYGKVLINGVAMNTLSRGKPEWSTWGGLNDVQRNQQFTPSLSENNMIFGDLAGNTNITMRPSQYRPGVRVSYATANKTYTGRAMGSYTSGLLASGWAYAISASRRFGNEGSRAGTVYDANSIYTGIEKKWKRYAINLIGMYTPNRRGRATALTEEVYQLKGRSYNPNWGYQNGAVRNARIQNSEYLTTMLSQYWNLTKRTELHTNVLFQSGKTTNSRVDAGGTDLLQTNIAEELYLGGGHGSATNPVHPTVLPSFYVKETLPTPLDFQKAFRAQQHFIADGQLHWDALIGANQNNAQQGYNATYIVYEDTMENTVFHGNMILNSAFNDRFSIQGKLAYRKEQQQHYAKVKDLLGGTGFLDIDRYAETEDAKTKNTAQNDLRHPNRVVTVGDRYKYQYDIDASVGSGFLQTQYTNTHFNGFLGGFLAHTQYQRTGRFENGYFPGTASLGKSSAQQFLTYGVKAGITYKINWRNAINGIAGQYTKAPTIARTFINPRQTNASVSDQIGGLQKSETITTVEANYTHHSSKLQAKITGYYTTHKAGTDIGFFFTQAIAGDGVAFVQQITTNIDKTYLGGELGISYQITPTLMLKSALAIGQYTYANAPELMLTSTSKALEKQQGVLPLGTAALQSYRIPTGPQHVGQLGFQYRDPKYWWFGLTANYFAESYSSISYFARTTNFTKDIDGLPFNDYDEATAKQLLQQERFDPYLLINATAGTSWRIRKYTIGLFAAVQNVFNETYKTGGFESSRMANYRLALAESKRKTPVYGSRYYYGAGITYYLNLYLRF